MFRLAALIVLAALALLSFLLAVVPASGVTRWLTVQPGIAQAVAFPVPLGMLAAAFALAALAWTVRSRHRRLGRIGVVLAVVFTASSAALVVHPFLPRAQLPPAKADLQMTVTTWNTADRLRAEDLLRVFRERDSDVLVMPETTASTVEDIVAGHPELPGLQVFTSVSQRDGIAPTTVLVTDDFGEYRSASAANLPELSLGVVGLEPVGDPTLPMIWAVHPPPPLPGLMAEWRRELAASTTLAGCHEPTSGTPEDGPAGGTGATPHRGIVVAGDFNATLRHGSLAHRTHCVDAVHAVGSGPDGTWPASWPAWLGSPIDHVLVSPGLAPVRADIERIGTSDHRVLTVSVRLDSPVSSVRSP